MRALTPLEAFLIGAVSAAAVSGTIALTLGSRELPTGSVADLRGEDEPPARATVAPLPGAEEISARLAEPIDAMPDRAVPVDAPPDVPDAGPQALDEEPDAQVVEEPDAGTEEELAEEAPAETVVTLVECGPVTCPRNYVCCNASCGTCAPPGAYCSQRVCGMPYMLDSPSCGDTTCNVNEVCCDPVCGRCIRPGEPCAPASCLDPVTIPVSESCGMMTCNTGLVCCNPSCGICKPPGEPCSHEVCD